ncbi:glycosyltransferase WbsX family protein [Clostridium sp. HCP1S3_B4]|uniref:glycosyltransferase WbsX family protein n=1 Tax=unclassified Clostridium TaxID=2614128 RepID=UPI003F8887C6
MTKIIAYYLPQFYETEYNNEWWGRGFTEWVHVKEAKPLYNGHKQPRVPLNDNYYNLLDKKTVEWQTKIANEYGIDGFAYYHYWFEGKMLLEKPAENLLQWKDINQKFFFFWANHTWYQAKNGKKKVLIEQTDGGEKDWREHYEYLKQFFSDARYIKIDDKPVFGIYNMKMLKNADAMIEFWNELAINDGYKGIFVIENKMKKGAKSQCKNSNAVVARQPMIALNDFNLKIYKRVIRKIKNFLFPIPKKPQIVDYTLISNFERNYLSKSSKKEYLGCSVGWDNTPRHKNYGQVFIGANPKLFKKTVSELLEKSERIGNEFIFINAWNEWAEGMYLEPDEENGYRYLEAIRDAKISIKDKIYDK